MAAFRIVVAGWGVFIEFQSALTNNDRAEFIQHLKTASERMASMDRRGVLLDLRRVDVAGDPGERVNAYVGIVKLLGGRRIAMVASSPPAAARLCEALAAAGLLGEQSRVLVTPVGVPNALVPALRWVDEGIEPDRPE